MADSRVLVFGVGGVGGFVCESLARTGVGTIGICDMDDVDLTNINRQVPALSSTVGRLKVDVMKERMLDINPELKVETFACRLGAESIADNETADAAEKRIAAICGRYDLGSWDYVVDAIDDVPAKVLLTLACKSLVSETRSEGIPIILSMGTGNKLDLTKLRVADISKTHTCPLAKAVRAELRRKGVNHVKCVLSEELPMNVQADESGKHVPATCMFVPAAAGLLLASEVVRELTGTDETPELK